MLVELETTINAFLKDPYVMGAILIVTELFSHSLYDYETDVIKEIFKNDFCKFLYWTVMVFLFTRKIAQSIIVSLSAILVFRFIKQYEKLNS
jgi:hypothetical protein